MNLPVDARITEFSHLALYNWIERPTPTIAVPGSPAEWSPPTGPTRLKKDTGYFYTAQNLARRPESPLEPLFCAMLLTDPSVDLRSIDVVTDRNNIRKLLSFVEPRNGKNGAEDFVINIEIVGKTALFSREEKEARRYIAPNEFRGHGHEFEEAYTTSKVQGSIGYYRIASYLFGDLKFLVRYEVDGYVSPVGGADTSSILAHKLSSLQFSKAPPEPLSASYEQPGSKLRVVVEGKTILSEQCLEIKTRVAHKPLHIQDIMPQLWASQTTKLVRAYHTGGLFQSPIVEDVTDEIKKWEKNNESTLKKLMAVVSKILDVAKRSGGPVQVRYSAAEGQLCLYNNDSMNMLPDDIYVKWSSTIETKSLSALKTPDMTSDVKDTLPVIVGGKQYLVDLNKFPFFQTLMASRSPESKEAVLIHKDIPFFGAINYSVQHGLRNLFRRTPNRIQDYHTLCETLDSLGIDVCQGLNLQNIIKLLKVESDDYDPEERRVIRRNKTAARDAAFRFVYLLFKGGSTSQFPSSSLPALSTQDRAIAYNAVSYVVSHRRIFGYKTRSMVREAFEAASSLTYKQRLALDKWPITEPSHSGWEDDETTNDEGECYADLYWGSESS